MNMSVSKPAGNIDRLVGLATWLNTEEVDITSQEFSDFRSRMNSRTQVTMIALEKLLGLQSAPLCAGFPHIW